MYARVPVHNMELQGVGSSMWYPVPMAPQEPNLYLTLMMIQMLSQMRRFQPQPISTQPLIQPTVELDIQSWILRAQEKKPAMNELEKSQLQNELRPDLISGETAINQVMPDEEEKVPSTFPDDSKQLEEKDALLKETKEKLEHITTENERINNEIKTVKEELENCRKNKEEEIKCNSIDNLHLVSAPGLVADEHSVPLSQGFRPGSKVVIRGRAKQNASRMNFNFDFPGGTAFHMDNRWLFKGSVNVLVMNTLTNNNWGDEVHLRPAPLHAGEDFVVSVQCDEKEFKICMNGSPLVVTYPHRADPRLIIELQINNAEEITSVFYQGAEAEEQEQIEEKTEIPFLNEYEYEEY